MISLLDHMVSGGVRTQWLIVKKNPKVNMHEHLRNVRLDLKTLAFASLLTLYCAYTLNRFFFTFKRDKAEWWLYKKVRKPRKISQISWNLSILFSRWWRTRRSTWYPTSWCWWAWPPSAPTGLPLGCVRTPWMQAAFPAGRSFCWPGLLLQLCCAVSY